MSEWTLPKHYRRNFLSLAADFGFFSIASIFMNPNTIVPSFLSTLGASSAVIGLVSSLQTAGGLLPQLLAARYLADKPFKKPYILLPSSIGRSLYLGFVVVLWLTRGQPATLTIVITATAITAFWVGNALASVAWLDLVSKVIPARRRGRLFGTSQAVSGLLGLAVGMLVEWMLSDRGPAFPSNYTWLLFFGWVMLASSLASTLGAVEEERTLPSRVPSWREYLPQLWSVLRDDHAFRRYIIARQLYALSTLSTPFYMTFALSKLGLPAQVAGRYTSIGIAGSILASVIYSWMSERHGSRKVMLAGAFLGMAVPLVALVVPWLLTDPVWLAWAYGLVFLCLNANMSSMMPGWMAYMLQLAPESKRPLYIGLNSTLNGFTTVFSMIGGLILQWTGGNYAALFAITCAGVFLALRLCSTLPEQRQVALAQTASPGA